jgi:proline iminopeptidase
VFLVMRTMLAACLLSLVLLPLTPAHAELASGEGFIEVPGGKVWYRVYAGAGGGTPLLALHGGPGGRSCVLSALSALTDDRPVILYDQLGGGRSGRPDDASLWTLERAVEELATVRRALGLQRVHLLGHSWGAALAAEYVLSRRPDGVASVVFASPLLGTPHWEADMAKLRAELPDFVQRVITKHEAAGTTGSDEYLTATELFYMRHLYHRYPAPSRPECEGAAFGDAVYQAMWGPSEFAVTGSLKTFDRTRDLHRIEAPVLFMTGQYDEARPETVAEFQRLTPGSRFVVVADSAHMLTLEQPEVVVGAIRAFLRQVDASPAAVRP